MKKFDELLYGDYEPLAAVFANELSAFHYCNGISPSKKAFVYYIDLPSGARVYAVAVQIN